MCRILAVQAEKEISIADYLEPFADLAEKCKEYQGHGWGCSYLIDGIWGHYKTITPAWEDDLKKFGKTTLLLVHARSAFRDEGIVVENNMPFYDEKYVFIFNGELHGVTAKAPGRIGAEKVFNYIKRFDHDDILTALMKGVEILNKKTRYIRTMNFIISDGKQLYISTQYNDGPDYFTLRYKKASGLKIICSEPFPGEVGWKKFDNNTIMDF